MNRRPTPPSPLVGDAPTARLGPAPPLPEAFLRRLAGTCAEVVTDPAALADAGRDWWPLSVWWAGAGQTAGAPGAVARPATRDEVAAAVAVCHEARIPVTPAAGRSGVCGGAVPVFGGVAMELTGLTGVSFVAPSDLLVGVRAGTWGDDLEATLRAEHGLTVGHWPQSMAISTVGGWVACRGAGQYSTRYGKVEDMVAALEVVLADGRVVHTGGGRRARRPGPI